VGSGWEIAHRWLPLLSVLLRRGLTTAVRVLYPPTPPLLRTLQHVSRSNRNVQRATLRRVLRELNRGQQSVEDLAQGRFGGIVDTAADAWDSEWALGQGWRGRGRLPRGRSTDMSLLTRQERSMIERPMIPGDTICVALNGPLGERVDVVVRILDRRLGLVRVTLTTPHALGVSLGAIMATCELLSRVFPDSVRIQLTEPDGQSITRDSRL
jgi:hypothetical protein